MQELKCWIFDIYLFDWFDAIGTNVMYMHPYIRLYGASVLLFKIEYTVKKLKKFVMPSPVDHNPGISWGVPDSQQILQRNKNEKCHGVCGERGVSWV